MKVYYDSDASLDFLKDKKIAVLGFGSQDMLTRSI